MPAFSRRNRRRALALSALCLSALAGTIQTPVANAVVSSAHFAAGRATFFPEQGPEILLGQGNLAMPLSSGSLSSNLPLSVDWSKYAVSPGNQGPVNSCVSWTIGYSMLGWYAKQEGASSKFAPMYTYSQTHEKGQDSGTLSQRVYQVLMQQGTVTQEQYPEGSYNWRATPSEAEVSKAAANRITAPHYIYSLYNGGTPGMAAKQALMQVLASGHPVALGIDLYLPFNLLNSANPVLHDSSINVNDQSLGNHAVLAVGYNATGVIVENSWGDSWWGNKGFGVLDWAFIAHHSHEASWIDGFNQDVAASVPAQPEQVSVESWSAAESSKSLSASLHWAYTAAYADSVNHPVLRYQISLDGSDGTHLSTTATEAEGRGGIQLVEGLKAQVRYTYSIRAVNAVGAGVWQRISFTADGHSHYYGPLKAEDSPLSPLQNLLIRN